MTIEGLPARMLSAQKALTEHRRHTHSEDFSLLSGLSANESLLLLSSAGNRWTSALEPLSLGCGETP